MDTCNSLYSNAEMGVLSIRQAKATPEQWLHMLINSGFIKTGEDNWTGLSDWLKNNKKHSITKDEILSFIKTNHIELKEIILDAEGNGLDKYSTQGLSNKKELIFSVPGIESWKPDDNIHYGNVTNGRTIAWARFGEVVEQGEKILFIDEIQSDRHQTRKMRPAENVPPAPFEKNWHEMVMKRLFRYAAENGFNKLAWLPGRQQNERYGCLLPLKELIYSSSTPMTIFPGKIIILPDKFKPTVHDVKNFDELAKITGKKIAERIENGEWSFKNIILSADGLNDFYDIVLPCFVNKYCKKWNIRHSKDFILGISAHVVTLTEAMKKSVMEGQAMFRFEEKILDKTKKDKKKEDKIKETISTLEDVLKNNVKIVEQRTDLPVYLFQQMKKDGSYPGIYDPKTDTAYMILSEIANSEDVEKVIKHEVLGHKGLRALKKERLYDFLNKVFLSIPQIEKVSYLKRYGNKYVATEEYIADQAENYINPCRWDKIVSIFRECARTWGFSLPFSAQEVRHTLTQSRKLLKNERNLVQISPIFLEPGKKAWLAKVSNVISDSLLECAVIPLAKKFNGLLHQKQMNQFLFSSNSDAKGFKIKCEGMFSNIQSVSKKRSPRV